MNSGSLLESRKYKICQPHLEDLENCDSLLQDPNFQTSESPPHEDQNFKSTASLLLDQNFKSSDSLLEDQNFKSSDSLLEDQNSKSINSLLENQNFNSTDSLLEDQNFKSTDSLVEDLNYKSTDSLLGDPSYSPESRHSDDQTTTSDRKHQASCDSLLDTKSFHNLDYSVKSFNDYSEQGWNFMSYSHCQELFQQASCHLLAAQELTEAGSVS